MTNFFKILYNTYHRALSVSLRKLQEQQRNKRVNKIKRCRSIINTISPHKDMYGVSKSSQIYKDVSIYQNIFRGEITKNIKDAYIKLNYHTH